jgi:hypothetical protein
MTSYLERLVRSDGRVGGDMPVDSWYGQDDSLR